MGNRQRLGRNRPSKHAHHLIVETAKEMAHSRYEEMMGNNAWYDLWKKLNPELGANALEEKFVQMSIPKLLGEARTVLAGMLGRPGSEALQETIYEALVLDNTLIRGR